MGKQEEGQEVFINFMAHAASIIVPRLEALGSHTAKDKFKHSVASICAELAEAGIGDWSDEEMDALIEEQGSPAMVDAFGKSFAMQVGEKAMVAAGWTDLNPT